MCLCEADYFKCDFKYLNVFCVCVKVPGFCSISRFIFKHLIVKLLFHTENRSFYSSQLLLLYRVEYELLM